MPSAPTELTALSPLETMPEDEFGGALPITHTLFLPMDDTLPLAPFVVAAGWVIRWVAMRALWPAFRWLLKKMFKVGVIGGTGFVIADWTWDKITSIIGEEATRLLIDNKIELALAAAFIVSAVVVKRWIEGKGDKLHAVKENIEQARGSDKMPKKKLGRTKHPLNGKLVGETE